MQFSKMIFNSKQLIQNLENFPTKNVCAMVKANAYGLGIDFVCKTLKGKVKFFGVATLEEALEIRAFDQETPILIVGFCQSFELAAKHNISVTIENPVQFFALQKSKIQNIKIHIKINSGMNRFGFKNKKSLKKIFKTLKNNKNIIFEGFFTHFSFLKNKKITSKQLKVFQSCVELIPKNFSPIIHVGGSGVIDELVFDDYKNFMVRAGIKLYENVLSIESCIVKIFEVAKHESVGYDEGFVAKKRTQIAIVPLGYADGIARRVSGLAYVDIEGKLCKIVGNVCMDCFFVDVSGVDCHVGAKVVVFSDANAWAKICQTIPYEILTNFNFARMKKVLV